MSSCEKGGSFVAYASSVCARCIGEMWLFGSPAAQAALSGPGCDSVRLGLMGADCPSKDRPPGSPYFPQTLWGFPAWQNPGAGRGCLHHRQLVLPAQIARHRCGYDARLLMDLGYGGRNLPTEGDEWHLSSWGIPPRGARV